MEYQEFLQSQDCNDSYFMEQEYIKMLAAMGKPTAEE